MDVVLTPQTLLISASLLLLIAVLIVSGCATARITSSPSNADVFVNLQQDPIRPYQWKKQCVTPCSIPFNHGVIKLYVHWRDDVESDSREGNIVFPLFQTMDFHVIKPVLPVEQLKRTDFFFQSPCRVCLARKCVSKTQ